jgi:hypothetical protein
MDFPSRKLVALASQFCSPPHAVHPPAAAMDAVHITAAIKDRIAKMHNDFVATKILEIY